MKNENNLDVLNDYLFATLERLDAADDEESINKEIIKSKSIVEVGKTIISNAETMLAATKHISEYSKSPMPKMIGVENNET